MKITCEEMSDKAIESEGPKQDDVRHFGNFLKEFFSLIFSLLNYHVRLELGYIMVHF